MGKSASATFGLTALAQAAGAFAQPVPAPPPAPPAAKPDRTQDIVVVAPAQERSSIDRTTYLVRDTPEARSASTLDVLARVPFVEVTPSGQIRLLGTGNVKILIDGKPVADAMTMLRNLQGSQIAKIEVITNPSAQFSAQGTGGIINIVTRRTTAPGIGGSVTANGDSFGTAELKVSPTWARGRVSLSGSLDLNHGGRATSRNDDERYRIGPDGALVPQAITRAVNRFSGDSASGNLIVSYKPTAKQTISLSGFAVGGHSRSTGTADIDFGSAPAASFRQTSHGTGRYNLEEITADYRRDGPRDNETLTASAKYYGFGVRSDDSFLTSGAAAASGFESRADAHHSAVTLKLDYVRPFAKRRLSVGGSLGQVRDDSTAEQEGQPFPGGPLLAISSRVRGSWIEESAYATYQAPFLGGTIMPGLRLEGRRYSLANAAVSRLDRHDLFPTLHFERKLAKSLTGDLSYSRRVQWPDIGSLDPSLRFLDPRTASAGNPDLKPEITHSFEAKLAVHGTRRSLELTAYSRKTEDSWAPLSLLGNDGVLVTRQVNFGTRLLRGASAVLQGSLGRRFHYSLSGHVADTKLSSTAFGAARAGAGLDYGGSATLDYREGTEGRRGADHVALTTRYSGPYYTGFSRVSSSLGADASWSHALTDRLSSLVKVTDLAGAHIFRSTNISADSVSRDTSRNRGRRITVSLTYSLAKPPPR
ncbi:MAG: ferric enterobactin receptor [Sphingomonadales bacterium]|nr:ferric enterobactin receptor [Sphingomonadales bacterium]